MNCLANPILILRAIKLGNYDGRAGRKSDKEADQQVDQHSGTSAYRRQGLLPYKPSNNNCIYRIIELLKKRAKQNRKEKQ